MIDGYSALYASEGDEANSMLDTQSSKKSLEGSGMHQISSLEYQPRLLLALALYT